MKKIFILALLTMNSLALGDVNRDASYLAPSSLNDFVAPSVPNEGTVTNLQTGMIIFDLQTGQFKGLNGLGTWSQLSPPSSSSFRSEVTVEGGNGHGSPATRIRRFSNQVKNSGSDITYADSGTSGGSFTINSDGIYAVSYSDRAATTSCVAGISVNAVSLTTDIDGLTYADGRRSSTYTRDGGQYTSSWTGFLASGDVVRAQTDSLCTSTDTTVLFTITKVSN